MVEGGGGLESLQVVSQQHGGALSQGEQVAHVCQMGEEVGGTPRVAADDGPETLFDVSQQLRAAMLETITATVEFV